MLAVKEDGYVRGLWNEGARRKAENGRLPGDGVEGRRGRRYLCSEVSQGPIDRPLKEIT